MSETKHILILANSKRPKGFCVAGKIATPLANGQFGINNQWIRLIDPRNPDEGVPYGITICRGRQIRPLDVVVVVTTASCENSDHPEDCFFDPSQPWQKVAQLEKTCLPQVADCPTKLWHDGAATNAVAAGYVSRMQKPASSIYLVQAAWNMNFCFYKTMVSDFQTGQPKMKYIRDLSFHHAGIYHEFSVTDPIFMKPIWNRMTEMPQNMIIQGTTNHFLCLSLGLSYHGRHYKIGATIFQP